MHAAMSRRTIVREVAVTGTALHSGASVTMALRPAPLGAGIVFCRTDLAGAEIPARYDRVCDTRLGTVIAEGAAKVGVIEHLMAAIAGVGIDDLLVSIDGPEPPILDGSALGYLELCEKAGLRELPGAREAVKVLRRVEACRGDASAALFPAGALSFEFTLEYPDPIIGRQDFSFPFDGEGFRRDIAPARTFGFVRDLEALNKMGLGRGASLENTLALEETRIVNADKMRFADEFVRHKILDAVGDLALAGCPLVGRFEGIRSGHALNNALLRALFADPANYRRISIS
jgi:UDP-3-O-[3-hydroxymyristoyl] N-acetylglucosamine deacetylase